MIYTIAMVARICRQYNYFKPSILNTTKFWQSWRVVTNLPKFLSAHGVIIVLVHPCTHDYTVVSICDRICENVHSSHKNFNSFF